MSTAATTIRLDTIKGVGPVLTPYTIQRQDAAAWICFSVDVFGTKYEVVNTAVAIHPNHAIVTTFPGRTRVRQTGWRCESSANLFARGPNFVKEILQN